ncbi:hypothetical protein ES703_114242 [subsurface metagenome]
MRTTAFPCPAAFGHFHLLSLPPIVATELVNGVKPPQDFSATVALLCERVLLSQPSSWTEITAWQVLNAPRTNRAFQRPESVTAALPIVRRLTGKEPMLTLIVFG